MILLLINNVRSERTIDKSQFAKCKFQWLSESNFAEENNLSVGRRTCTNILKRPNVREHGNSAVIRGSTHRYLRESVDNSDSLLHKSLNARQKLKPRSTSKPRCNFGSQTPNQGSFCSFFVSQLFCVLSAPSWTRWYASKITPADL